MEPPDSYPISVLEEQRAEDKRALGLAREFKRELDARGTTLVLTTVPYTQTHTAHLAWLSRELDAPYILPSFKGMETADGSHLTVDSRRKISREIWPALMELPAVKSALETRTQ